ncbi:MAG: hypothetical protein H6641_15765 [Caldilineaceae bacterium]|nr:hypothetical protein [Caldilineaceae bacterium]
MNKQSNITIADARAEYVAARNEWDKAGATVHQLLGALEHDLIRFAGCVEGYAAGWNDAHAALAATNGHVSGEVVQHDAEG